MCTYLLFHTNKFLSGIHTLDIHKYIFKKTAHANKIANSHFPNTLRNSIFGNLNDEV